MKGGLGDGDRMIISENPPLGCEPPGVLNLLAEVLCFVLGAGTVQVFKGEKGALRSTTP